MIDTYVYVFLVSELRNEGKAHEGREIGKTETRHHGLLIDVRPADKYLRGKYNKKPKSHRPVEGAKGHG